MRRKGDGVAGIVHREEHVIATNGHLLHVADGVVTRIELDDDDPQGPAGGDSTTTDD